jgi:V8-like Glu-specific endopeptidase
MHVITKIIILMAASMTFSAYAMNDNKVIYGDDNRLDLYETTDSLHLDLARSTAAMISTNKIKITDDIASINGNKLSSRGICATAKFAEQMTAANCSGFLVGEDLLVTAGHCMKSASDCSGSNWVFDYAIGVNGASPAKVSASSVYECSEIISQTLSRSSKEDFALIRLKKKVIGRPVLKVRTEGRIGNNTALVVIGHPTGLPTKVSAGANVRTNSNSVYFVANLDTFGGNSGSAVFDAKTGTVEGILVRGETDYVYDSAQGCRVPKQCKNDECRGEDVTRITNIKKLLEILAQQ